MLDGGMDAGERSLGNDAADSADAAEQLPPLTAGAASVEITPSIGVPLGGFGARRLATPDANPFNDFTFYRPSVGVRDPLYCKALVLQSGADRVALLSVDTVAVSKDLDELVLAKAQARGVQLTSSNLMMFASHTHSGTGAVSRLHLWEQAALDLHIKRISDELADRCAESLLQAQQRMQPAELGIGVSSIDYATHNRRAGISPTLTESSIDPTLMTIRVDRQGGAGAIATLWNFAIHGNVLGSANLRFSADIMGAVSAQMEADQLGVAIFANSAEGDISPVAGDEAGMMTLAAKMATDIKAARAAILTTQRAALQAHATMVPFGEATLRAASSNVGGDLGLFEALQSLGLDPSVSRKLGSDWIDNEFRFQAVRINDTVLMSVPGEPIQALGTELKNLAKAKGFARGMVIGLSNGHMGYITTEAEYKAGGQESLSTMFGVDTAQNVIRACAAELDAVRP